MITEGVMTWGDFSVKFLSTLPDSVKQLLHDSPFAQIRIWDQRINEAQVGVVSPLYTGVLLERPDGGLEVQGSGPNWYLGAAGDGTSPEETGPLSYVGIGHDGSTSGTLTDWVNDVMSTCATGITATVLSGPADKHPGLFERSAAKTILDTFIVPRFTDYTSSPQKPIEYRVTSDLELEIGYSIDLHPLPSDRPLAISRGGRDPANQGVLGLNATVLNLAESHRDDCSRVITVIDSPHTAQEAVNAFWAAKNPAGDPLNWTVQKSGTASSQATTHAADDEALADANAELIKRFAGGRTISVSAEEYALTSRVKHGDELLVYGPEDGLFDQGNPTMYEGQWIYPVKVTIQQIAWPVVAGMSVFLDNRHQGGGVTDLTRYVDFTADGTTTTLTVGAPPLTLGRILPRR